MEDESRRQVVAAHPIGNGLNTFRASFGRLCESKSIICSPHSLTQLDQDDLQDLSIDILLSLQRFRASRLLIVGRERKALIHYLPKLVSTIASDESNFEHDSVQPLLESVIAAKPEK
ncbi:hypothetical protein PG985_001946 [Apiospora marii]|uniref:uncharacterized protein n=1 Tax=Apiospora marii TaxID=335849 RepID=UPI00313121CF